MRLEEIKYEGMLVNRLEDEERKAIIIVGISARFNHKDSWVFLIRYSPLPSRICI